MSMKQQIVNDPWLRRQYDKLKKADDNAKPHRVQHYIDKIADRGYRVGRTPMGDFQLFMQQGTPEASRQASHASLPMVQQPMVQQPYQAMQQRAQSQPVLQYQQQPQMGQPPQSPARYVYNGQSVSQRGLGTIPTPGTYQIAVGRGGEDGIYRPGHNLSIDSSSLGSLKQAGNYGLSSLASMKLEDSRRSRASIQRELRSSGGSSSRSRHGEEEPPPHVKAAIAESLKSIQEEPRRSKSSKSRASRKSTSSPDKKKRRASLRKSIKRSIKPDENGSDDSENLCVICDDKKKTHMCYPCGHRCFCASCVKECRKDIKDCPLCRKPVKDIIKVFD